MATQTATKVELLELLSLVSDLAAHLENYSDDVARYMGAPGFRTEAIQDVLARAEKAVGR